MISTLTTLLALLSIQDDAAPNDPELTRVLEPALVDVVERFRLPGLAIGVVRDGEIIYRKGFGEAVRGSGRPITTQSIFHMASVSKPFTATAAMQLVEAGKLELDAPLTEYLPYFRLADERYEVITVRQVLTHTSGMPDVRDYEWDKPQFDEGAAERFVRGLTGEEMIFSPGGGSRYSNMAFDVMGDVIAKVSGMSFDDYVRTRILEPIGMTNSSFIHSETPEEHRTQGHSLAFSTRIDLAPCPVYPYNRRHAPSSTLNSNIDDMCRWALANLEHGELDGARILETGSYDEMWAREDETPSIGLSWFLGDLGGHATVSHSGGDTGFNSNLLILPDDGIAAVAMVNCDMSPVGQVTNAAVLAALGEAFTMPTPRISFEFAHVLENEGSEAAIERYFELFETERDRWAFGSGELELVVGALMSYERYDDAVAVAALNADVYSQVGATHTTLGQAMAAAGDVDGAREAFEHALLLTPNDRAAEQGLATLSR
jgi:CubicO group peptidase (beta-lactamase class C family)